MSSSVQNWLAQNRMYYEERQEEPLSRRRYAEFTSVHVGNPIYCDSRGDGLWGHCNRRWFKLSAFPQAVPALFAITPSHVDCGESCGTFGRSGIEYNASRLLHYAQEKCGWADFTAAEVGIAADDGLDYLAEVGFLLKKGDKYSYTIGFVFEFYAKYPAK